jgi:hypothetical protein
MNVVADILISSSALNCCMISMINTKTLISLKPFIRTQRSYKRVGLKNGNILFEDSLFVRPCSVDVLTNASKVLIGTHYTSSVTLSVTRDFNIT